MTTDHTPGPWTVEDNFTIMADVGAHICKVSEPDDFPCLDQDEGTQSHVLAECGANARLIAAAPDMLAALKSLAAVAVWGPEDDDREEFDQAMKAAQAAIARAEGRESAKGEALVVSGYIITHPHEPYEGNAEIHINEFDGDVTPWQAQIFVDGSLVEADYFPTEAEALRWSAREMTLIACVAKAEGREG